MVKNAMEEKEVLRSYPTGEGSLQPWEPVGSLHGRGEAHFRGSLGLRSSCQVGTDLNKKLRAEELKRATRDHTGVPGHRQWGFGEGPREHAESRSQQHGVPVHTDATWDAWGRKQGFEEAPMMVPFKLLADNVSRENYPNLSA